MSQLNRWAILARKSKPKRSPLDDYETPDEVTFALGQFLELKICLVLEPCAGSGRMLHAIQTMWPKVQTASSDIKRGRDFLKRTRIHEGSLVTNPPYRNGMAQKMVDHALNITDGKVAMLLQSDFIWGQQRGKNFYLNGYRPEMIIVIPWRINFFIGSSNKIIDGQFFSHAWVIWPKRSLRASNTTTFLEWATQIPKLGKVK